MKRNNSLLKISYKNCSILLKNILRFYLWTIFDSGIESPNISFYAPNSPLIYCIFSIILKLLVLQLIMNWHTDLFSSPNYSTKVINSNMGKMEGGSISSCTEPSFDFLSMALLSFVFCKSFMLSFNFFCCASFVTS